MVNYAEIPKCPVAFASARVRICSKQMERDIGAMDRWRERMG